MNNDLISRSNVIEELNYLKHIGYDNSGVMKLQNMEIQRCISVIKDAPAVTPDMAQVLAYESGKASAERPQGEYVDISKLRLMTVEECAGHTIDYAMGWKACIEWIKKGGADNEHL